LLTAFVYIRHIENEMPLTINHRREMSTVSGNDMWRTNSYKDSKRKEHILTAVYIKEALIFKV
jgi:hypothetical protein